MIFLFSKINTKNLKNNIKIKLNKNNLLKMMTMMMTTNHK